MSDATTEPTTELTTAPTTEPAKHHEDLATTGGREAQPRDRGDVADNAEKADRLHRHAEQGHDAAGNHTQPQPQPDSDAARDGTP